MEVGGTCPSSVSACTSCCKISLESIGLVLDMGADSRVEQLRTSVGCSSTVQVPISCGWYWKGLGESVMSGRCTKVLASMGVGAVGGLGGWGGNWCVSSGSSIPKLTYLPNASQPIW